MARLRALLDFFERKMFVIRTNVPHKNTKCNLARQEYGMRNPRKGHEGPRNVISERLRRARLAFNPPLTQDELSGRLAVQQLLLDRVAITKIENGQRCVFDFELAALTKVLKVDVRWLLGIQPSGGPLNETGRASDGV